MHRSIVAWLGNRVILRKVGLGVLAFAVMVGLPSEGRAITLTPSVASPQMLGTPVTWTAAVQNPVAGDTYDYQFSVTFNGQTQVVQDFSPTATFTWVPHTVEGAYQFNVIVRNITTAPYGLFAPVSANFNLLPWVTAPLAAGAVNPTSHPLVALFSGPPCAAGHQLLVRFHPGQLAGFDDHQPGAVLDSERELLCCRHVSIDPISDALGGIQRNHPREHGRRSAVHHATAAGQLPRPHVSGQRPGPRRTTRPIQSSCFRLAHRPRPTSPGICSGMAPRPVWFG